MRLPKEQLEPIMTNSENIIQFGPNAYAKPATALNILRETIMGRELFDYAFKEYAQDVGLLNILHLQIFLEQWKMLVAKI
jgi:hypothetical protein